MQNWSTTDLVCVVKFIYYHERYFQVFRGSSKKINLSDTLKMWEARCASFVAEKDDFDEGIDLLGCRVILFNCLKNIEAKVMELNEQGNEN